MLSKSQRIHFMAELWPNACAAQGWNRADDEKRYDLFAQLLGRKPRHAQTLARGHHISLNDFDNSDFDAVKAHLQMLAGLIGNPIGRDGPPGRPRRPGGGALEVNDPSLGLRRRLEYKIREAMAKLANVLPSDQVGTDRWAVRSHDLSGALLPRAVENYVAAIIRDKFGRSNLSELGVDDLRQLLITLSGRLSAKKKSAKVGRGAPRPPAGGASASGSRPVGGPASQVPTSAGIPADRRCVDCWFSPEPENWVAVAECVLKTGLTGQIVRREFGGDHFWPHDDSPEAWRNKPTPLSTDQIAYSKPLKL
jgi:hypothetical protein